MRIGLFTYDFDPPIGGLGVYVQRLVEACERVSIEHDILVFSPSKNSRQRVGLLARRFWRRRGGAPLFSLSLSMRLGYYVRKHKLDLVHVQGGSGGVMLVRKPRVPLLVTAHHTYRDEAIVYKGKPLTYARKMFFSLFERRTYVLADRVICVSADTKKTLETSYGIDPRKLDVIENSVPLDQYEGGDWVKEEAAVLFIGRLEPRKGLHILLDAFMKARAKHPHARLKIIGEDHLQGELLRRVEERDMMKHVELLGRVTDDERVRQLKSAAMLVMPSIVEGFGLSAAEAMAAGTLVIASNCPGLRSIISHERTGLLFTTGDADACAAMIDLALRDHDLRERLARAGRREAWDRFAPVRQAKQTLALYERTVTETNK